MKSKLYKGLSFAVKSVPQTLVTKFFGQITPIFYLHRLSDTNPSAQTKYIEHVEWCLQYIRKNKYKPITLKQYSDSIRNQQKLPEKSVVFTLDDGFSDQCEIAEPLFSSYEIPYTCFVITDFLDNKIWPWDDQITYLIRNSNRQNLSLSTPNGSVIDLNLDGQENCDKSITLLRRSLKSQNQDLLYQWLENSYDKFEVSRPETIPEQFKPMTWSQAQSLIDKGHDIAPHTVSHRILSQLSEIEAHNEIDKSFKRVNLKLKGAQNLFAYPTGRKEDFTTREISTLKSIGAECAVSTTPAHAQMGTENFTIPRYSLPENRFDFIQYLSFFEHLKQRVKR